MYRIERDGRQGDRETETEEGGEREMDGWCVLPMLIMVVKDPPALMITRRLMLPPYHHHRCGRHHNQRFKAVFRTWTQRTRVSLPMNFSP